MIDGKMISMKDGTEYKFQIERSRGSGALKAWNPVTGEALTGQYTGKYTGGGATFGTVRNTATGQTSNVTLSRPPSGAEAMGFMRGDKGTVIEVALDIVPGLMPRGWGEGRDNAGNRYQIQF